MTQAPLEVSNCPEQETLAAFIDDRLTGAERQAVVEHLAECGECRSLVLDATEFKTMDEANVVRPGFGQRPGAAIGVIVAVAAALVVVFGGQIAERLSGYSARDIVVGLPVREFFGPDISDLVKASEESTKRPVEGRLAGDFPHQTYDRPKRSATNEDVVGDDANWGLIAKAYKIQEQKKPDRHALGVSHLVLRQRKDAVVALRAALSKGEGDERTAIANDLAVALIADGVWGGDDALVQEALTLVEQELRTKRTPELLWNRALALNKLKRHDDAKKAWQEYLEVDSTSEWAQEVRDSHLRDDGF